MPLLHWPFISLARTKTFVNKPAVAVININLLRAVYQLMVAVGMQRAVAILVQAIVAASQAVIGLIIQPPVIQVIVLMKAVTKETNLTIVVAEKKQNKLQSTAVQLNV